MSRTPHQIYFDRWSKHYDRDLARFGYSLPQLIAHNLPQHLPTSPRILDVGIGTGLISAALKASLPDCYIAGIDTSPRMLAQAAQKNIADDLRICDVGSQIIPYANNDFDAVIAAGLLEFIESPANVLAQSARVLKTDGILVLALETDASAPMYRPGILRGVIRQGPAGAVVRRLHYTPWPRMYLKHLHNAGILVQLAGSLNLTLIARNTILAYTRPNGDQVRHDVLVFKKTK